MVEPLTAAGEKPLGLPEKEDLEPCWYCGGADPDACPICATPRVESREEALRHESTAILGQDGWAVPEDAESEERLKASGVEGYNLSLLVEAESRLRDGDWEVALELSDRGCRNLELHVEAAEGRANVPGQPRPFLRRGEKELLALAFAHRARCHLLQQDYRLVMDDCRRFGRMYGSVVDAGQPALVRQHEQKLLEAQDRGAGFLGNVPLLEAACEIACECRERVGSGFAPKVVMEHTQKAIEGLEPVDFLLFPGLNSLRAHLHVTRAHAALELERWEEAKADAEMALACDPRFKEAEYMRQAAESEEW